MYNPGEINGFCLKSCYLRLLSDLFMNVMQQPEPDLLYSTDPRVPRSDGKTFFWSSPTFGRKMLRKSPKCQRPRIRPGNNMVSWRNPLLYHFLTTIHFQLASFYAQNIEKKLAAEILIEQIFEFELKGPEPPGRTCTPITG